MGEQSPFPWERSLGCSSYVGSPSHSQNSLWVSSPHLYSSRSPWHPYPGSPECCSVASALGSKKLLASDWSHNGKLGLCCHRQCHLPHSTSFPCLTWSPSRWNYQMFVWVFFPSVTGFSASFLNTSSDFLGHTLKSPTAGKDRDFN